MTDTLDVLTFGEAKEAIRSSAFDSPRDSIVTRLNTTVSRKLDQVIGPVVSRTVTNEQASAFGRTVELAHGPATSIVTVVEYQDGQAHTLTQETYSSTPTDAYLPERYRPNPALMSGVLVRRVSGSDACWWEGQGNVLVTYVAGRVANTTSVDPRHKEAAALMLRNLWRTYDNSVGNVDEFTVPTLSFPTFAIPNAVRELLDEEWQTSAGFGA